MWCQDHAGMTCFSWQIALNIFNQSNCLFQMFQNQEYRWKEILHFVIINKSKKCFEDFFL